MRYTHNYVLVSDSNCVSRLIAHRSYGSGNVDILVDNGWSTNNTLNLGDKQPVCVDIHPIYERVTSYYYTIACANLNGGY